MTKQNNFTLAICMNKIFAFGHKYFYLNFSQIDLKSTFTICKLFCKKYTHIRKYLGDKSVWPWNYRRLICVFVGHLNRRRSFVWMAFRAIFAMHHQFCYILNTYGILLLLLTGEWTVDRVDCTIQLFRIFLCLHNFISS